MPHWHSLTLSPPNLTAPFRVGRACPTPPAGQIGHQAPNQWINCPTLRHQGLSVIRPSGGVESTPTASGPAASPSPRQPGFTTGSGPSLRPFKLTIRIGPAVVLYCHGPTLSRPGHCSQAPLQLNPTGSHGTQPASSSSLPVT